MPSTLITEMEHSSNGSDLDQHRAIQLALELTWLNLNSDEDQQLGEMRAKKSMNMTECVPVPSSEHVAEIVGRQGCKIKALRAKTNTYIKTPVRGEEPVFVVTGRKEDVALAKREILQAAEHFSQIRASRRNSSGLPALGPSSPTPPGHIKKQVRVPYKVVGLVVGPKGATIKRIQQATNTYIVTPSRDKEPVFEVTGSPDDVDKAKKEIEHHIAQRTGGFVDTSHPENGDSHFFNGLHGHLFSPTSHSGFSAFLDHPHTNHHHHHHHHPRSHSTDSFPYYSSSGDKFSNLGSVSSPFSNNNGFPYDNIISPTSTELDSPTSPAFDPTPGSPAPSVWPDFRNTANRVVGSQSQGLNRSTSINNNGLANGNDSGRSSPESHSSGHQHPRRLMSEPFGDSFTPISSCYTPFNASDVVTSAVVSNGALRNDGIVSSNFTDLITTQVGLPQDGLGPDSSGSKDSSPDNSWRRSSFTGLSGIDLSQRSKKCFVCQSSEVVAALIPCGHNLFCMECAQKLKDDSDGECPACNRKVEQVLRIFS